MNRLEHLAAIEHRQWVKWSQTVAEEEDISQKRLDRWQEFWIPYVELPEDIKEYDREYARIVLRVVE